MSLYILFIFATVGCLNPVEIFPLNDYSFGIPNAKAQGGKGAKGAVHLSDHSPERNGLTHPEATRAAQDKHSCTGAVHEGPLLVTKLLVPHLHPGRVPRPRLIARLDQSTSGKLILVSAQDDAGQRVAAAERAALCLALARRGRQRSRSFSDPSRRRTTMHQCRLGASSSGDTWLF
jgi:hypothetical protein